ncbi:MAG: hypothetical protein A2301_01085 [Candidatus Magasanikbacteria bacterium RIFOXYB2_FULL_40_13]|uniref:DUF4215 domain-containing protein n=2 Tax=Candidatus Magasanikiibacteriota TaxID=1752731 RepID=A0A1F6NK83_9BACT|nr:MAG: hypothetical protein A2224_03900 [Candidatus Magasanikbacteria bacterium RIFOXYA2_FULL_40_20]OGH84054.1 MAG: hypothetical protein A2373_03675 [Candidatus Magasanikbacteria bacterium RIFOXYB1_FULL_40_15]OGH86447.1 MAG: hypothetical protein A2301_01085 [Candidatus Magasanikbacteria bacterium RIFOXYB2_FULL_40_13]
MKKINILILFFVVLGLLFTPSSQKIKTACNHGVPDGTIQAPGEECDTTILANTASCDYDGGDGLQACTLASCGDNYTNSVAGETCDDGINNGQPGGFLFTDWSNRIAGSEGTHTINSVEISGNYAYVASGNYMYVVNISNPTSPYIVGTLLTSDTVFNIKISGSYAYLANGNAGLRVVNISNPNSPTSVITSNTPGTAYDVAISGTYAYVADYTTIRVINISNPSAPMPVGGYSGGTRAFRDLTVSSVNRRLYASDANRGMVILNISTPSTPTLISDIDSNGGTPYGIEVDVPNLVAYLATSWGMEVININNEWSPVLYGVFDYGYTEEAVVLNGKAYVAGGNDGLHIVDVSTNASPRSIASIDVEAFVSDVVVSGNYAFLAAEESGLVIVDITPTFTPTLATHLTSSEGFTDIDIEGGKMYLGETYNAWDTNLKIFDLTNPTSPSLLNSVPFQLTERTSDLKVRGDYLYSAELDYGLRIYRVNDPAHIIEVGSCDDNWGAYTYCTGLAFGVDIDGNYAYLASEGSGLNIIDITDPEDPHWVSTFAIANVRGVDVSGNYAYVNSYGSGGGLTVVNITNKAAPSLAGRYTVDSAYFGVINIDDYVYMSNGYMGLRVFNVSNKSAPQSISLINTPQNADELAIYGNYAFVADNTNMQVINVRDPYHPNFSADYRNTSAAGSIINLDIYGDYAYLVGNTGLDIIRIRDSSIPNYCNETCDGLTAADCGNALVEAGEECDDGYLNTISCTAGWGDTCEYCSDGGDGNTACTIQTMQGLYCGDGILTLFFETCDDGDNTNANTCNATCSGATVCGDGTRQTPNGVGLSEVCDDGNTTTAGQCNPTCTALTVCGDNVTQTPNGAEVNEVCDDGDNTNANTCNATCTAPTYCGDGTVQAPNGLGVTETCDDGNAVTESCIYGQMSCTVCGSTCQNVPGIITYCGDNVVNGAEMCDDGNTITETCVYGSSLACMVCNATCQRVLGVTSYCGDGTINGPETCDDGDNTDANTCNATCTGLTICGDSVVQDPNGSGGSEDCDPPGSLTPFGTCSSQCQFAVCGNNYADLGEDCDVWPTESPLNIDTLACDWDGGDGDQACTFNACGTDGYLNDFEVCDLSVPAPLTFGGATCSSQTGGSLPSGTLGCDLCDSINITGCYLCGNETLEDAEYCDDGNTVSGDGCESTCMSWTTGWSCIDNPASPPAPDSLCAMLCGNGNPSDPGEVCDDGNDNTETILNCAYGTPSCTFCNADCSQILNFTAPFCGDGVENIISVGPDGISGTGDDTREACDLGVSQNNDSDCSYGLTSCTVCLSNCSVEQAGNTSFCGDEEVDPAYEDCDYDTGLPATSGDGCSSACEIETGYVCAVIDGSYQCVFSCGNSASTDPLIDIQAFAPYNEECDAGSNNGLRCVPVAYGVDCIWCTDSCELRTVTADYCGDGEINNPPENCDQGNTVSGDGCSATCQEESGFECTGTRDSTCDSVSGDGICVGAPFETCINNFNDCGACSIVDVLTALPGESVGVLNGILESITNIFPTPQLRINIPGLNLNKARIDEALEVLVSIGKTLEGPTSKTKFYLGNEEKSITIDEIKTNPEGIETIDISFE